MAFMPQSFPSVSVPSSDFDQHHHRDGVAQFDAVGDGVWTNGDNDDDDDDVGGSSSMSSSPSSWDLPEPPSIGKALRNFRINGLFCDVALHFTSNSWGEAGLADALAARPPPPPLFAHKVVLAACSPYFFSGRIFPRIVF